MSHGGRRGGTSVNLVKESIGVSLLRLDYKIQWLLSWLLSGMLALWLGSLALGKPATMSQGDSSSLKEKSTW